MISRGIKYSIIMFIGVALSFACNPIDTNPPVYPVKSKTVLVYMVANNNLSGNALTNLKELEQGFLPNEDGDNLIVYSHTATTDLMSTTEKDGSKIKPKLIRMYRDAAGKAVRDTVYKFPELNSALPATLTNALNITNTMFPANEKGLILWSHGTGWLPSGYYARGAFPTAASSSSVYGVSQQGTWEGYPNGIDPYAHLVKTFGDDTSKEIEITDLEKALPYKLNFIIFDACLMGGIEVAYELKEKVDFMVSSPAETLVEGLGYSGMMKYLLKQPTDLIGMAKNAYDFYMGQSNFEDRSITISIIETAKLAPVAAAAKNVFAKYGEKIATLDVNNVQKYFRGTKYWFYDINDFIKQLVGTAGAADAAIFTQALDNAVIYKATSGRILDIIIDINKYSGVSTYIPRHPQDTKLKEFYQKYAWDKEVVMIKK